MKFRKNDGKYLTSEYHAFRENARQTAFHPDSFAEADQIEFELDTAGITGRDNNQNWHMARAVDIFGVNGTDVRDLRDR